MEFLKEILGEELFAQVAEKINAHNGNEANKDKQVKLGNLGGGEYVGKGKYDALQTLLDGKTTELETANDLIAKLKKGTKGNEELQGEITNYQKQVTQLQAQLQEAKVKAALKVALLSEKATDIEYLTFKVNEQLKADGKALELDENENIKGVDDLISGLKTQLPNHFETVTGGRKVLGDNRLPKGDGGSGGVTKAEFLRKSYAERAAFARENPEAYKEMMNH